MDAVTSYMYERQSREEREHEDRVRGGKHAYEVAAEKFSRGLGLELSEDRNRKLGIALHAALGYGASVLYAIGREPYPALARGNGLFFGLMFFLLIDEGLNTVAGFTPPPHRFRPAPHIRGLVGHLVYGFTAETV